MGKQQFYYKDTLEAAYMCHEHGMTYIDEHGVPYGTPSMVLASYSKPRPHKHIIDPLRLHLLEPKVGDLCLFRPHQYGRITEGLQDREIGGKGYTVVMLDEFFEEASRFEAIIQRDGKSFFWPESQD